MTNRYPTRRNRIADDIIRKEIRQPIDQQAKNLLNKLPKDDNHYKYIEQIAGHDKESKEKINNIERGLNENRQLGPSPRSARELLKSFSAPASSTTSFTKNKTMSKTVYDFVSSNLNQLKSVENKGRDQQKSL